MRVAGPESVLTKEGIWNVTLHLVLLQREGYQTKGPAGCLPCPKAQGLEGATMENGKNICETLLAHGSI
jgi:hypothetical protein